MTICQVTIIYPHPDDLSIGGITILERNRGWHSESRDRLPHLLFFAGFEELDDAREQMAIMEDNPNKEYKFAAGTTMLVRFDTYTQSFMVKFPKRANARAD